ncbi:MAG: hypothetical protein HY703_03550, partial [Gemmatimonadetes bacterium]|nr:hypothetical protein [Gemmatimonadota bacterium]
MKKLIAGSTALLVLLAAAALLLFRGASPGQSCRAAASWGAESGLKLEHPMAIGWGAGLLYVADAEHGSIKVVDGEGSLIDEWPGFSRPVAVAPAGGAVYVADFLADQVVHLDADGKEIRRWGRQGRGAAEFDA